MRNRFWKGPAAAFMAFAIALPSAAQTGDLRILVREGEGAVHNIRRKAVSPIEVEVRDERNRPVSEAKVRFTFPEMGPGGRFVDGSRTLDSTTDNRGRAGFSSFLLNQYEGRFALAVRANASGREAAASITQTASRFLDPTVKQTNPETRKKGTGHGLALVAGIGLAATIAAVIATRGNGGPSAPPVSIGVGGVSVGGPR